MLGQVVRNQKVILRDYAYGKVTESDMEVREGKICLQLKSDKDNYDVLVKNLYLSPDPYMRSRMKGVTDSYIPPFTPGEVGFAILE
jgi:NADPH-dependent curcumin reductase CurA